MEQQRKPPTPASWKPGQSGNPGGRPRSAHALSTHIRQAGDHAELYAIALHIARTSDDERNRIAALTWIREAGFAKPAERHELALGQPDDEVENYDHLSVEQLRELHGIELELENRRRAVLARPALLSATTGLGPVGVGGE